MRVFFIAVGVAVIQAATLFATDPFLQRMTRETEVFPEITVPVSVPQSKDEVAPGMFSASAAGIPAMEPAKTYTDGLPVTARLNERVCDGPFCSSHINVESDAFAGWEGLCHVEELKSHNGCPLEATFSYGGIDHRGSVHLKKGEAPFVMWESSGPPDESLGVFTKT